MSGISYTLVRSSRKTISILVKPTGEVEVRCPKRCSKRDVEAFVTSKEAWIQKHLESLAQRPRLPAFTGAELQALTEDAKQTLPEKVRHFAAEIGVSYSRVTIRSQHTRWGSCSAKGNLNFNCLLMLCPENVQNYVVIHELCHRKEMNHSPRFWALVEQHCPDYRACRTWLKEQQQNLIGRLP